MQRWEETDIADTLTIFDNTDARTPILIVQEVKADGTDSIFGFGKPSSRQQVKICDDGIFQTLSSRMGTGGGNVPMVLEVRTMQNTTGTLSPGAHAGSYNGQDAYNDMLVVEDGLLHRERTSGSINNEQDGRSVELYARSTGNYKGGCINE